MEGQMTFTKDNGLREISDRQMYDAEQLAELLNCSSRHVRRMALTGRMPKGVKFGLLRRWPRKQINEWLNAGCPEVGDGK